MQGSGRLSDDPDIQPVVAPGTLPPFLLDQENVWIDPKGFAHRIDLLNEEDCLWTLDYILANARLLRDAWAKETKSVYPEGERARRWMLDRRVTRKFMRRLVELEGAQQ